MDRAQALRVFQGHNRARISRLIALAPQRQAVFFKLLPLLFHINHKLLPGYINVDCPVGIMDYQPDNEALNSAISLNRNFSFRRKALRRYAFRGIYLLNAAGQIRYPEPAAFELWLVIPGTLKADQITLIQSKAEAVRQWADSLNIQLHIRVMDENQCQTALLSGTDREQLYLSGLCVAGSVPLWWLITSQEHPDYRSIAERLLSQRGLTQTSLLNFGFDQTVSANHLFNETCDALHRSLTGDITVLLDLLFAHCQLNAFPTVTDLSECYKQRVEQDETDTMRVEPASLKLDEIERSASSEFLSIARQAYYALCSERLSQPVKQPQFAWRRHSLMQRVTTWDWSDKQFKTQDERLNWSYVQRQQWWQSLIPLLKKIFAQLQHFAIVHSSCYREKLDYLQRLFNLYLDKNEAVIEQLPPMLDVTDGLEQIYLTRFSEQSEWKLSAVALNEANQQGLKQHASLIHVLGWAIRNHWLTTSSWLRVVDHQHRIKSNLILELAQTLLKSSLSSAPGYQLEPLSHPPNTEHILLFANLLSDPAEAPQPHVIQMASQNTDPLSYTSSRHNLVNNIELLVYNSWGQWQHYHFYGQLAVVESLKKLIGLNPAAQAGHHIYSWCSTPLIGQAINSRLQQLFAAVLIHYHYHTRNGRYLLLLGERICQLQWQTSQTRIRLMSADKTLEQALIETQQDYLPTRIDHYLDPDRLLNTLLHYQQQHTVSIFAYRLQEITQIYVVDELGRIQQFEYPAVTETQILGQLKSFIEKSHPDPALDCQCYQLLRQQQSWQINPSQANQLVNIPFSVIWQISGGQLALSLKSQTVKTDIGDPQLDEVLSQLFIGQTGQQLSFYYIDRLQFVPKTPYPSLFLLNRKYELEQRFNQQRLSI